MNQEKTAKLLLVVVLILAVFIGVNEAIKTVDLASVPEFVLPAWNYVVVFFSSLTGTTLVAFGRNVLGYLRNYCRTEYSEVYKANRFYETLVFYLGIVTTIATIVPAPYNTVFIGVVIVFDFAISEYNKLRS